MQQIERKPLALFCWWLAVIVLLGLVNSHVEWFLNLSSFPWIEYLAGYFSFDTRQIFLSSFVTPIRGMALLFSLIVLGWSILAGMNRSKIDVPQINYVHEFLNSFAVFILLCVLVLPTGLHGLSNEYSNTTLVMYDRLSSVNFRQRFLMPAVANLLYFRGDLFYFLFALICAFLLVFSLRLWFLRNKVNISFLNLLSIGTLGFVCFQLSHPGYPDSFVFIFILLAFSLEMTLYAKLSLFVLSLASHEASLIVWFALAFTLFDNKKAFSLFLIAAGIYVSLMLVGENGIAGILRNRQVGGISNLDWVFQNPREEWMGILLAFRAGWLIILGAVAVLWREKDINGLTRIAVIVLAGFSMTFLGVDTSRLVGWGFMALLLSWQALDRQVDGRWRNFINVVMFINLLIPPYFVQLNLNPYVPQGIYKLLLQTFFNFLPV